MPEIKPKLEPFKEQPKKIGTMSIYNSSPESLKTEPKWLRIVLYILLGILIGGGAIYKILQYPEWKKAKEIEEQKKIASICQSVMVASLTQEIAGQKTPVWDIRIKALSDEIEKLKNKIEQK
jgi:hypothetical protein